VNKCSPEKKQKSYEFVKINEIYLNFPEGEIVGNVFDLKEHNNEFYLVDELSHTIWVTDQNGELKRKIGRKGKGPGDLLTPVSIAFKGDTLFVLEKDNSRVSIFDKSGTFIRQFSVKNGMLDSIEISRNGDKMIIGESLGIWDYLFCSINGEPLVDSQSIQKTQILMPIRIAGGQISVTKNDNILFSGIRKYNVVMLNWEGDTLQSFSSVPNNYQAPNLNNRKNLMKQKFWSIVTLPLEINNHILIQRFNKFLPTNNKSEKVKNKFYYYLFSLDGELIAESLKCECPYFLYQKNGFLYSINYTSIEKGKDNPAILVYELHRQ